MNKRILSLLLAIVMVLGVCAAGFTAFAAEDGYTDNGDGYTHKTPKGVDEFHSYVSGVCDKCDYEHSPHVDEIENLTDGFGNKTTDGVCDVCHKCINHRWELTGNENATCIAGASSIFSCLNCSETKTEIVSAALGHNWSRDLNSKYIEFNWDTEKFEYCEAIIHCTRKDCSASLSYVVYAGPGYVGNNISSKVIKAATCTEIGKKEYTATFTINDISGHDWEGFIDNGNNTYTFSNTYTVELTALGHNCNQIVSSKNPDCENPRIDTYKCTRCDYTEDIENKDNPALGHDFKNYVYNNDATCAEDGTETATCSRCEKTDTRTKEGTKLPHTPENVPEVAPTCTEVGYTAGVRCSVCKEIISGCEEVAALGHVFKNYKDDHNGGCTMDGTETAKCERGCGATDSRELEGTAKGHIDIDVDYKCDVCNEALDYCKAAGHEFTDSTALAGEKFAVQFGDVCAANDIDIDELKDEAHFFQCSECKTWLPFSHKIEIGYKGDGTAYHWVSCSDCDYRKDMVPHKDEELNYVDEDGNLNTDGLCDFCKGELTHRYKKSGGGSATCTEGASYTYTCMNCGDAYGEITSAALGHDWGREPTYEWDTVNFRSCTAVFKCARTGCTASQSYTVYAGSGYIDNIVLKTSETKATCSEDGEVVYTATFTIDDMGVTGWSGMKKNSDGTFTFSTTYTVKIPKLGHDYSIIAGAEGATCTEDGVIIWKCTRCDSTKEVIDEKSPKLGHNVQNYVDDNNATCTQDGTKTGICSRCGEKDTVMNENSALGHKLKSAVKEHIIPATCVQSGSYEVVIYCERCDAEINRETVNEPARGHEFLDENYFVTKEATCGSEGEKTCKCENCDELDVKVISATGDHTWKMSGSATANCVSGGYEEYKCKICGTEEKRNEKDPLGHYWTDDSNSENPKYATYEFSSDLESCTLTFHCRRPECSQTVTYTIYTEENEDGYIEEGASTPATCEVGSGISNIAHFVVNNPADPDDDKNGTEYTFYATTEDGKEPALGHEWSSSGVQTLPTCTEPGKIVYTCTREGCNKTKKDVDPDNPEALGHEYIYEVTREATCQLSGMETGTCGRCGSKTTKTIAKTEHVIDKDSYTLTTKPTCTKGGVETGKCTVCGNDVTQAVPALGHNYKDTVVKATCTEVGYTLHKCTRNGCDAEYKDNYTSKIAHEYVAGTCIYCKQGEPDKCNGNHFDPNYDFYCDTCDIRIEFAPNALHYIVGIPQFWMRVVFRMLIGGDWRAMLEGRHK